MKPQLNIKSKMLLFILSTAVLIFASTIGYISSKNHKLAISYATRIVKNVSTENALRIEKSLSENLHVLKTLAEAFSVYTEMDENEWKPLFIDMYKKVYVNNPEFYKLWDSWELSFFDTTWNKNYGRYAVTVFDNNNQLEHSTSLRSMDGDGGMYAQIKSIAQDMLWEPYWDEFLEDGEEKKFMTSISAPIMVNGAYAGIVAADIIVDRFQKIVESIEPYEGTTSFLVSNNGVFVGHSDNQLIGSSISEHMPEFEDLFDLTAQVKKGAREVYRGSNSKGAYILTIAPISIGEYNAPWSLGLIIPQKQVLTQANNTLKVSIIVATIGLILLSLIVWFISQKISLSINKTTKVLQTLAKGDISQDQNIRINSGDEVQEMSESVNTLLNGLNKTTAFANQIEQGNLNADFIPLSDKDTLGNALLQMRSSLKNAESAESLRKIEDEKQNWTTNGLAIFSDILRDNSKNINSLSYAILSHLINYLDINQGGLFIVEKNQDEEVSLNLTAAVAYGREKLMEKSIKIGEGQVGRCAFEKQSIYLTHVPDNYLEITSGMGTANPTMILLVPLMLNEEIHGVIELASFNKLEPYHIKFVETIGESIASTISSAKIAETTSKLLEQAKSQAEELSAQEEEMRQNLEELQATQEEAKRRENEMEGVIDALDNAAFTIEYDDQKRITSMNNLFADFIGTQANDLIGKSHAELNSQLNAKNSLSVDFWNKLMKGNSIQHLNELYINEKTYWISETFSPIRNRETQLIDRILCIGFDLTDHKD